MKTKKIDEVKAAERFLKEQGFKKVPKSKLNQPIYKAAIEEYKKKPVKKTHT